MKRKFKNSVIIAAPIEKVVDNLINSSDEEIYGNGKREDFIDMEEGFQSSSSYDNNTISTPDEQEFNGEVFGDDSEVVGNELDH